MHFLSLFQMSDFEYIAGSKGCQPNKGTLTIYYFITMNVRTTLEHFEIFLTREKAIENNPQP